ncbi:MAG: hypothetical protein LBT51_08005 [Fusobacteriaceae bacterium]|jgi:hypothetical protein|nr:hypothetical protein [Fusobacteriaceae bacterium]
MEAEAIKGTKYWTVVIYIYRELGANKLQAQDIDGNIQWKFITIEEIEKFLEKIDSGEIKMKRIPTRRR